jgi:hypothetical protein
VTIETEENIVLCDAAAVVTGTSSKEEAGKQQPKPCAPRKDGPPKGVSELKAVSPALPWTGEAPGSANPTDDCVQTRLIVFCRSDGKHFMEILAKNLRVRFSRDLYTGGETFGNYSR